MQSNVYLLRGGICWHTVAIRYDLPEPAENTRYAVDGYNNMFLVVMSSITLDDEDYQVCENWEKLSPAMCAA